MESRLNKNRILFWIILFFLTLFLHFLLLLLLFLKFGEDDFTKPNFVQFINEESLSQNQKGQLQTPLNVPMIDTQDLVPEEVAAMKAKKTNLGMPIADIEKDDVPEILEMHEDAQKEESEKSLVDTSTMLPTAQPVLESSQSKAEELLKPDPSTSLVTNAAYEQKVEHPLDEFKQKELDKNLQRKKEEIAQTTTETLKQGIKGKQKKGIMNKLFADKRKKIVPGIASFIGPEGEDLINRPGDENLKPTEEDFKKASYINKVTYLIQSAWKIKQSKFPSSFMNSTMGVSITIDKSGKILNLEKTKSTGYKNLDDLMMETIEFAAPFPPIPKHLKQDIFIYNPMIYIYMQYNDPTGKSHLF